MDYKYIENAKLRRLMQKARYKRKVLNNPNKAPKHEKAKIQQKYKNVIPIPSRKKGALEVPMYKQVCVIPFRRQALLDFNALPETELERVESIDMNRILEHGGSVKMVLVDGNPISVDTKSDLRKVSNFFSEKK